MAIQVGDKIPSGSFKVMGEEGPQEITTSELFDNKKVVMFAVPGAFTPGCSMTHLPGFVVSADKIKAQGVDTIICTAVNDAFVMGAWGKNQNAEAIVMAADGSADYAQALGLSKDFSGFGMGIRSQRYALIAENGTVTYLGIDEKGIEASAAQAILENL